MHKLRFLSGLNICSGISNALGVLVRNYRALTARWPFLEWVLWGFCNVQWLALHYEAGGGREEESERFITICTCKMNRNWMLGWTINVSFVKTVLFRHEFSTLIHEMPSGQLSCRTYTLCLVYALITHTCAHTSFAFTAVSAHTHTGAPQHTFSYDPEWWKHISIGIKLEQHRKLFFWIPSRSTNCCD